MFTACNHNGKHEVDHPDTKATAGLHIVNEKTVDTSVKIVRSKLHIKCSPNHPKNKIKRHIPQYHLDKRELGFGGTSVHRFANWEIFLLLASSIVQFHIFYPNNIQ